MRVRRWHFQNGCAYASTERDAELRADASSDRSAICVSYIWPDGVAYLSADARSGGRSHGHA